jgi:hypothetical protein
LVLLIARSIRGLFKDVNVDISKSSSIFGKVSQANTRKIKESTFTLKKYKTVFAIQLDNSSEKFAVDRGVSVCNLLDSEIKEGDSIKIYYRSSTGDFNTHIFQIEKNKTVIINSKDYSNKESTMITWGFILGIIITTGTIFCVVKQKKN